MIFKKYNPEMVKYWMTQESVEAKVIKDEKHGHYVMQMKGEKYPFPGYPRGPLLYGKLSKLKHEIKNQIFNETWRMLEEKVSAKEIKDIFFNQTVSNIEKLAENTKYDMVPHFKMVPPVRELYRALGVIEKETNSNVVRLIKTIMTFIFQEDDAYRFRFQDFAQYFNESTGTNIEKLEKAFINLEHAEIVGDMKERQRLWKRGFVFFLKDNPTFERFCNEVNWKKLYLTDADKYFFRAKYYKVDRRTFNY
jgi:hypothetical protein